MSDGGPGAVIVGAGLMGRWHAHALQRIGVAVTGVVDPDPQRGATLARRTHARRYTDLADALKAERPRVVHVCTPSATHAELAELAIAAGAHVVVEKPLAADEDGVRRILDAAAAANRIACPVHQVPFQRPLLALAANTAVLGSVRHVDTVACSAGADGCNDDERDRIAREILPHPLSILQHLFGAPVDRIDWRAIRRRPGEWRVTGGFEDMSIDMLVTMSGRPTRNTLRAIGERATLHADLFHGFAVIEQARLSRTAKAMRPFAMATRTTRAAAANLMRRTAAREWAYPGLVTFLRRFHDAVASGGVPPVTPEAALAVARASARIVADGTR